jgi:6-pyruvoyltetrahydropterin/6-carboxytetrahydropterin synthase
MKLGIETKFDAGHWLPNYNGKCSNQHGHTWHVKVEVEGEVDKESGMIVDFGKVKTILERTINKYDHIILNDLIQNPTCENLTKSIVQELQSFDNEMVKLSLVEIKEGDGGYCKWER